MKEQITPGGNAQSVNRKRPSSRYLQLVPAFAAFVLAAGIWFIASQRHSDQTPWAPNESDAIAPAAGPISKNPSNNDEGQAIGQHDIATTPNDEGSVSATATPEIIRLFLGARPQLWNGVDLALIKGVAVPGAASAQSSGSPATGSNVAAFGVIGGGSAFQLAQASGGGRQPITPLDNITGTGWKGTAGNNNWSSAGNWDNDAPTTNSSNDRNLFFGQGYANAGGAGSLTANNDLTSWAGYRITFQDIGNDSSGANDKSFTITGNSFTLFDFGSGNYPKIENDSFVLQTFNLSASQTITLSGGSNNKAEIDPANGNITFSANTAIDLAGSTQLQIFGGNGKIVTFNGAISSSGNSGNNSVVISTNTDGRTPTMVVVGTGSSYNGGTFVNAGTLQLGATGGANGAVSGTIFLGDNNSGGGNTPLAQLTIAGSGGQTFTNTINTRSGSAGAKQITTTYSGSDTWSGAVTLNVPVTVSTGSGSTLTISGQVTGVADGSTFLTKSGAGTLILQATNNTMTGTSSATLNGNGTQISAGTLGIYGDGSLGLAPAGAYDNVQFTGSATLQDTANNITLNVNRNISLATGTTATFDTNGNTFTVLGKVETTSTSATNLVASGGGVLILENTANTYTGAVNTALGTTTITGGTTLGIYASTSLGTAPNSAFDSILFTGTGGTLQDTSNTITLGPNRNVNVASGATATLDSNGNTFTIQGVISGVGSVAKTGAGTVALTGANTYGGSTSVTAGNLLVINTSGSGTGTGSVTVNNSGTTLSGGTTSGTGGISGPVNINPNANLSAGTSGDGVGTTAILNTGALTLVAASNFKVDITSGTPVAGSTYDQINVTGTVNLGGTLASNLIVNAGSGLTIGQKFFIVLNDGTDLVSGTFAQGATVTASNGDIFAINYLDNGDGGSVANDISLTFTAVPEPSTWIAAALSLGALGCTQRRRFVRLLKRA